MRHASSITIGDVLRDLRDDWRRCGSALAATGSALVSKLELTFDTTASRVEGVRGLLLRTGQGGRGVCGRQHNTLDQFVRWGSSQAGTVTVGCADCKRKRVSAYERSYESTVPFAALRALPGSALPWPSVGQGMVVVSLTADLDINNAAQDGGPGAGLDEDADAAAAAAAESPLGGGGDGHALDDGARGAGAGDALDERGAAVSSDARHDDDDGDAAGADDSAWQAAKARIADDMTTPDVTYSFLAWLALREHARIDAQLTSTYSHTQPDEGRSHVVCDAAIRDDIYTKAIKDVARQPSYVPTGARGPAPPEEDYSVRGRRAAHTSSDAADVERELNQRGISVLVRSRLVRGDLLGVWSQRTTARARDLCSDHRVSGRLPVSDAPGRLTATHGCAIPSLDGYQRVTGMQLRVVEGSRKVGSQQDKPLPRFYTFGAHRESVLDRGHRPLHTLACGDEPLACWVPDVTVMQQSGCIARDGHGGAQPRIGLCEGALKPAVAAAYLGFPFIGAWGGDYKSCRALLETVLTLERHVLGCDGPCKAAIELYPDAGVRDNADTAYKVLSAAAALTRAGYSVRVITWGQLLKREQLEEELQRAAQLRAAGTAAPKRGRGGGGGGGGAHPAGSAALGGVQELVRVIEQLRQTGQGELADAYVKLAGCDIDDLLSNPKKGLRAIVRREAGMSEGGDGDGDGGGSPAPSGDDEEEISQLRQHLLDLRREETLETFWDETLGGALLSSPPPQQQQPTVASRIVVRCQREHRTAQRMMLLRLARLVGGRVVSRRRRRDEDGWVELHQREAGSILAPRTLWYPHRGGAAATTGGRFEVSHEGHRSYVMLESDINPLSCSRVTLNPRPPPLPRQQQQQQQPPPRSQQCPTAIELQLPTLYPYRFPQPLPLQPQPRLSEMSAGEVGAHLARCASELRGPFAMGPAHGGGGVGVSSSGPQKWAPPLGPDSFSWEFQHTAELWESKLNEHAIDTATGPGVANVVGARHIASCALPREVLEQRAPYTRDRHIAWVQGQLGMVLHDDTGREHATAAGDDGSHRGEPARRPQSTGASAPAMPSASPQLCSPASSASASPGMMSSPAAARAPTSAAQLPPRAGWKHAAKPSPARAQAPAVAAAAAAATGACPGAAPVLAAAPPGSWGAFSASIRDSTPGSATSAPHDWPTMPSAPSAASLSSSSSPPQAASRARRSSYALDSDEQQCELEQLLERGELVGLDPQSIRSNPPAVVRGWLDELEQCDDSQQWEHNDEHQQDSVSRDEAEAASVVATLQTAVALSEAAPSSPSASVVMSPAVVVEEAGPAAHAVVAEPLPVRTASMHPPPSFSRLQACDEELRAASEAGDCFAVGDCYEFSAPVARPVAAAPTHVVSRETPRAPLVAHAALLSCESSHAVISDGGDGLAAGMTNLCDGVSRSESSGNQGVSHADFVAITGTGESDFPDAGAVDFEMLAMHGSSGGNADDAFDSSGTFLRPHHDDAAAVDDVDHDVYGGIIASAQECGVEQEVRGFIQAGLSMEELVTFIHSAQPAAPSLDPAVAAHASIERAAGGSSYCATPWLAPASEGWGPIDAGFLVDEYLAAHPLDDQDDCRVFV